MRKRHIDIFDTTLRDGEQSPGFTMNSDKKVIYARQAEKLGVNVIEAGFAISSPDDFESIRRIAEAVRTPVILSLARTKQADIEAALKSVENADHPGIHIFIATSDIHLTKKLMMSQQEVIDSACWAIDFAKKQGAQHIEFSAEDATRTSAEFLCKIYAEVIKCGATVLNIPDTTGCAIPAEFGKFIQKVMQGTARSNLVRWSAHCHNDLGRAVGNSLAAIEAGVSQIECTINGIGERAGNAALEEIAANLRFHEDYYNVETSVVLSEIYRTSQLLCLLTDSEVQPNKPIIGDNAFAHEAGVHQAGVLKDKLTYEILKHEEFGIKSNRIELGKHSGRSALNARLSALGFKPTENTDMNVIFEAFKKMADKKGRVDDDDLIALVAQDQSDVPMCFKLKYLNVTSSSMATPHATVIMEVRGTERTENEIGDGMVDACFKVIEKIVGYKPKVEQYRVEAITGGTDAVGEVSCYISHEGIKSSGQGSHTDIIQASALAYINALNRLEYRKSLRQSKTLL